MYPNRGHIPYNRSSTDFMELHAQREAQLAPYAMHTRESRGRRFLEPEHAYRSAYARDRDRVIHARAFRRLEHKTQVFTSRYSDHFRNRLTHTLEVSQIARTVAGALNLNTELVEALALVHDIGHSPFGHAGERKLNELMRAHGSFFDHNLHALRIVETFEQRYLEFPGLNLTFEVREGIVKHSRDYDAREYPQLAEYLLDQRPPLEAQLIDWVDEIAYNTADLDDALEAELLNVRLLREEVPLFAEAWNQVDRAHPAGREKLKFNEALKIIVNRLATNLIQSTEKNLREANVKTVEDVRRWPARLARLNDAAIEGNAQLKKFLARHLYQHAVLTDERDRSVACLEALYRYYLTTAGSMPPSYEEMAGESPRHIVVCDYIAGMTDHYLLRMYREHFGGTLSATLG